MALNLDYAEKEVEMQLLAAQQGWRLLYAYLTQDLENIKPADRPATAIFIHEEQKINCLSVYSWYNNHQRRPYGHSTNSRDERVS